MKSLQESPAKRPNSDANNNSNANGKEDEDVKPEILTAKALSLARTPSGELFSLAYL